MKLQASSCFRLVLKVFLIPLLVLYVRTRCKLVLLLLLLPPPCRISLFCFFHIQKRRSLGFSLVVCIIFFYFKIIVCDGSATNPPNFGVCSCCLHHINERERKSKNKMLTKGNKCGCVKLFHFVFHLTIQFEI